MTLHICHRCGTQNELLDDGETRCSNCGSMLAIRDKALADRLDEFWENKKTIKDLKNPESWDRLGNDMYTCAICHAMVHISARDLHVEWHDWSN